MPAFKACEDFTRPVPVTLPNGDVLTVHYCPARYTTAFFLRASSLQTTDIEWIYHMLGGVTPEPAEEEQVAPPEASEGPAGKKPSKSAKAAESPAPSPIPGHWDWTGEDGKPIPITLGFLMNHLPLPTRLDLVKAINADIFPTPEEERTETLPDSATTGS